MNEIFSQSVENLALKIKNSELTSVELCEKYIERIDKFEKEVKAWAFFDKKILLEKLKRQTTTEDQVNQLASYMVYL